MAWEPRPRPDASVEVGILARDAHAAHARDDAAEVARILQTLRSRGVFLAFEAKEGR
jgi:hypothetical protein